MSTYLFVWNPKRLHTWKDFDQRIGQTGRTGHTDSSWSTGNRKDLPKASRFFLIKLGTEPKGIVGSGITTSEPYPGPHWNPRRRTEKARYVRLRFDFPPRDVLVTLSELQKGPLSSFSWALPPSGRIIPERVTETLERIWTERTGTVVPTYADEIVGDLRLPEGARRRVIVNAYERNPDARRKCIAHYGTACTVCDVDLGTRFGPIATGFIHVHHVVPLSKIGKAYVVDPVKDLIPVCPTCHAVLHLNRGEPLSISEARALLKKHSG